MTAQGAESRHDESVDGRCRWPLGTSGALSVTCALKKGHAGPHKSVFESDFPTPERESANALGKR